MAELFRDSGMGLQGKLHVAPALDSQSTDNLEAGGAEHLVFLVAQGLAGGHYYAVARVDTHGIQVFHVADSDAVVSAVPHHLVFDLFPPRQRTFQEDLGYGAGRQTGTGKGLEFFLGVGNAAAAATQGVGRSDDEGKAHLFSGSPGLFHGSNADVLRLWFVYLVEKITEIFSVFGAPNGLQGGSQQAHVVTF